MQSINAYIRWGVYFASSFIFCVWIVWHVLAQANFLYPVWYSVLSIDATIEEMSPRHIHKDHFERTSPPEHQRLFAEIVDAVQNNGKGLADIYYVDKDGQAIDALLTQSEITHLKDVSRLIQQLNHLSVLLAMICMISLAVMYLFKVDLPAIKRIVFGAMITLLIIAVIVYLAGAKEIFYWLHTQVFPVNHQWFFYYEESLMSTLMKAPLLFAPISLMLVGGGALLWVVHLVLLSAVLSKVKQG